MDCNQRTDHVGPATVIAFTGPRPGRQGLGYGKTPLAQAVVAAMRAKLVELAPSKTISGMALGVDQWGAWLSVKLGIPFVAAVPFWGQEEVWRDTGQRLHYRRLMDLAAEVHVCAELDPQARHIKHMVAYAMQKRNEWMVDNSDVLLAVWDGSDGGTANCVRYAEKVGRRVERIDPRGLMEGRRTTA